MDDASADLILFLQTQDLADIATKYDNKEVDNEFSSDALMARDFYRQELRNEAATIANLRFGEKVGKATGDQNSSPIASPTPMFDHEIVEDFGLLRIDSNTVTEDQGSSSDHLETSYHICVICTDQFRVRQLITAPCGDRYCTACLGELYDLAMKDESLFPPRCCRQPIPLEIATQLLSSTQVQKFHEKTVEFTTHDRVYCHETSCGAFLGPDRISGQKATCNCGALTCAVCKAAAHHGDCPEDPAHVSFMAFARIEGYQTCRQCQRMVELSTGCNHITCLCGAQFCYVCGATWKQCSCPQFDVARLYARAEAIVDRAPARQPDAPVVARNEFIRRVAEELQENHDCDHEGHRNWQRMTQGDLTCENCSYRLPNFILECRQCHLRACARCVRNRL